MSDVTILLIAAGVYLGICLIAGYLTVRAFRND